jgi:hypothetical protein
VTEYRVPTWASGADGIAAGGAVLWFTEHLGDIVGRVTTSGAISEFPVPTPNSFPDGITLGPRPGRVVRGAGRWKRRSARPLTQFRFHVVFRTLRRS